MKIHIVVAALPPLLDGIGDYTAKLTAELAHSATVTVLTGASAPDTIPGVHVETAFSPDDPRSVWNLVAHVSTDAPDWLLLQYQPFSYGRWGLNLHLPRVIQQIKRQHSQTRFALMVHEPFVPVSSVKNAVMTTWQRWQLWKLGQEADIVFFSIEPWALKFAPWFPGKPVVHLPVGSNIPLVMSDRNEVRGSLGIAECTLVLGLFGTAHSSRLLEPIRSAAEAVRRAGQEVQVLYLGPQSQTIRDALSRIPVIAEGPLPPEEVSSRFAAIDIYFAAYTDGVSTRRTSLMTGLQHGTAIVGTRGRLTDKMLVEQDKRAFILANADKPRDLDGHVLRLMNDKALREELGGGAKQLYQKEFAWAQITARLLTSLANQEAHAKALLPIE